MARSPDRTGHTRNVTAAPSPTPVTADLWGDADGQGRRQLVFDLATGTAFAVVVGALQLQLLPWTALAAVLLGAALAVRRLTPLVMVALAIVASVVQVVSGNVAFVACVGYVPLFVTLGTHRDARMRRLGLACAAVAVVVAGAWAWAQVGDEDSRQAHVFGSVAFAALTAVVVAGSWTVGFVRWQRRQAVQARADATLQTLERRRLRDLYEQEQERSRIAADMHDLVAHSWAVVAAQADGARYVVHTDPDRAQQALTVIGDTARSAMGDVRVLLGRLREQPGRDDAGEGLEFEQPDALVARMRASGMDLRLDRRGGPAPTGLLEMTSRRVLTESLTNALKHGDLSRPVEVTEDWRDGYRLRVSNTAAASDGRSHGHGLLGMAERIALAGGSLTAQAQGDQWVLEAHVPEGPTR
jgi:signal transduction histidine kinase